MVGLALDDDPEQRCYEVFHAAFAEAVRRTSPALIGNANISHGDMLAGLASAHIAGVAAVAASVAVVTAQPPERIADSMIASLRERIDDLVRDGVSA